MRLTRGTSYACDLYLELLEKYFLKQEVGKVDWGEIWRTVEKISPDDWETLKNKLRQTYTRLDKVFHDTQNRDDEDMIGAALADVNKKLTLRIFHYSTSGHWQK